jgi:hypothetical protein
MVAKLKEKFIPKDYQINIYRRLQNLKQRGLLVKNYTKEFYQLNIRVGKKANEYEKIARYINGLRYEIQEEINIMHVSKVEYSYHAALKSKEKLARYQSQQNRGGNSSRGKGTDQEKFQKLKPKDDKQHSHHDKGGSSKYVQHGGRGSFSIGRGRGRAKGGIVKFYTCGKEGHKYLECRDRNREGREPHIVEA